jgi:hypothetical protein
VLRISDLEFRKNGQVIDPRFLTRQSRNQTGSERSDCGLRIADCSGVTTTGKSSSVDCATGIESTAKLRPQKIRNPKSEIRIPTSQRTFPERFAQDFIDK